MHKKKPSLNAAAAAEQHAEPGPTLLRFRAFPYSGVNDYLLLCTSDSLSLGGGEGRSGLWLDDKLERGLSGSCPTFGNEGLSDEGNGEGGDMGNGNGSGDGRDRRRVGEEPAGGAFEIVGVEVWGVGA